MVVNPSPRPLRPPRSREASSARRSTPVVLHTKRELPPPDNLLLALTDRVRISLRQCRNLGERGPCLMRILGSLIKSEAEGVPMIGVHSIMKTRLDRLLADMTNQAYHPQDMSIQFRAELSIAESLQRQWRKRFGDQYENMDQLRYNELAEKGGRLDGIEFNAQADPVSMDMWVAKTVQTPSEVRADGELKEGRWWPTVACVQRDGIDMNTFNSHMNGRGAAVALPLIKGTELAFFPSTNVQYVREGTMDDMCVQLMSKVGTNLMIFRGHCLQSPFAPDVGVRYDGQYILRQYSQRRNPQTELHRLTLTLERVEDQKPMQDLCAIPFPSQIDEWRVFDMLEGDMVRQELGEAAEIQRKLAMAKYGTEKKQLQSWLRVDQEAKTSRAKIKIPVREAEEKVTAASVEFSGLQWEC